MKLTKCVNGHFYDEEKFESCPHCAGGSKLDVNAIFGGTPSAPKPAMSKVERDDDMTVPLDWTPAEASVSEPTLSASTDTPIAEPLSPTVATSTASSVDVPEEKIEQVPSDTEVSDTDIHSQPSFDTPLGFNESFTEKVEKVEDKTVVESKEEFEPFSKFNGDKTDSEESEITVETEPFDVPESAAESDSYAAPEATTEPEPFIVPEPTVEPEPFAASEATAEPEPFAVPEATAEAEPFAVPEATAEAEPFAVPETTAEPEPFAVPETTAEPEPFAVPEATAEPEPFAASEPVAEPALQSYETSEAAWEMPQPSVEEIPTGDHVSGVLDPELEDKPTEIVDETDLGPFVMPESAAASTPEPTRVSASSVPSPAAAMFGTPADDDDDEHTVAFYDEIFVSKAPAAPVVPEAVAPASAVPSSDVSLGSDATFSGVSADTPESTENVPEPDVFTAPPLQPAQALPTPCVGWLIALNGVHIGQDFHLRVGKNYIGRDVGMDIALTGDKSVSRNKHAIVIYEPKHHKYFIQPGESNELVYVNDEVVLLPMPLKPYDVIVIGDIEMWFIPLCDDQHNWSEVIRRLQEQM